MTTFTEEVGVGGLCLAAARTRDETSSPDQAERTIAEWHRRLLDGSAMLDHSRDFPFKEVIGHLQSVGRTNAAPDLTRKLREVCAELVGSGSLCEAELLVKWLPSTIDQEDGDYDTYYCAAVLDSVSTDDQSTDMLLVALVAELALQEAVALWAAPHNRLQQQRTLACCHAMAELPRLAPKSAVVWEDWSAPSGRPAPSVRPKDKEWAQRRKLAADIHRRAEKVLDWIPVAIRSVVELSMLPTTQLHDERMFIRNIQVFECVFRQIGRCVQRGITEISELRADRALAELTDAADRLEAVPTLFRVLTTIPKDAFALIRDQTQGRSAVQSRGFRYVEQLCAPSTADRPDVPGIVRMEIPGRTFQEAVEAASPHLAEADTARVLQAMRRLDHAWCAMKRTHWGITLKIIGTVPGTGGTSGASYLERAASHPLFPGNPPTT